jgi:hypothetical protein
VGGGFSSASRDDFSLDLFSHFSTCFYLVEVLRKKLRLVEKIFCEVSRHVLLGFWIWKWVLGGFLGGFWGGFGGCFRVVFRGVFEVVLGVVCNE